MTPDVPDYVARMTPLDDAEARDLLQRLLRLSSIAGLKDDVRVQHALALGAIRGICERALRADDGNLISRVER